MNDIIKAKKLLNQKKKSLNVTFDMQVTNFSPD